MIEYLEVSQLKRKPSGRLYINIPKKYLEEVRLHPNDPVSMFMDGNTLVIIPLVNRGEKIESEEKVF